MAPEAVPFTGSPDRGIDDREARRLLARMDRMEEFAVKYEQIDRIYPGLPKWELECQRRNYAATYRRLIGVAPEERDKLRQLLTASKLSR